jgi:hypothetical protein
MDGVSAVELGGFDHFWYLGTWRMWLLLYVYVASRTWC